MLLAVAAALPWVVLPILLAKRIGNATSLDSEPIEPAADPPMVSVIVPARNEETNIANCVKSILSNTYPRFEVIVVDDSSTDRTGEIARQIALEDSKLKVVNGQPLPSDWLGKPFACFSGARAASGQILCFTDADTSHSPDLLIRAVNAMLRRNADLLSIFGDQRLESFWDRIVQPQVFTVLGARYGGTETVTQSRRTVDKIASGPCTLALRSAYDELGGHQAVKDFWNEDIMLAQVFFANGKMVALTHGGGQLSTRMYASIGDAVRGWARSLYTGLRLAAPPGTVEQAIVPVLLLLAFPVFEVAPSVCLLASLVIHVSLAVRVWAIIGTVAMVTWWAFAYSAMRQSVAYAFLHGLGAAVLFYIGIVSIFGRRTLTWKGRFLASEEQ